jgi:hypothetical protein
LGNFVYEWGIEMAAYRNIIVNGTKCKYCILKHGGVAIWTPVGKYLAYSDELNPDGEWFDEYKMPKNIAAFIQKKLQESSK